MFTSSGLKTKHFAKISLSPSDHVMNGDTLLIVHDASRFLVYSSLPVGIDMKRKSQKQSS